MPSLDKTTLIAQVRTELIETGTTSGQWSDTELAEFLQEANEYITDIAELEVPPATALTVAAQEYVDFPATIAQVLGVWCRQASQPWSKLRKMDIDEWIPDDGTSANRGMPSMYMIWNSRIYLSPIPNIEYTLRVMGYGAASDLVGGAGSTVPLFNMQFHPLLKFYAIARAKQKMDDQGYTNYDNQYADGVLAFRQWKEKQKNQEGPRGVKIVSGMWD